MKILVLSLTMLVFAQQSFAGEKICFGGAQKKGQRLIAIISETQLTIKPLTSEVYDKGTFELFSTKLVHGQDGRTYFKFRGEFTSGDCNPLYLVDTELVKDGTTGALKIDCMGNRETYICRDEK